MDWFELKRLDLLNVKSICAFLLNQSEVALRQSILNRDVDAGEDWMSLSSHHVLIDVGGRSKSAWRQNTSFSHGCKMGRLDNPRVVNKKDVYLL